MSEKVNRNLLMNYFKEILIVAYLLQGHEIYIDRISSSGFSINLFLYIALFLILSLCLLMASYIQEVIARYLYAITFFISSVFIDVYIDITNNFMGYNAFISLVSARGFVMEVFYQYLSSIIAAVMGGLILFVGVVMEPKRSRFFSDKVLILSPVVGVALLSVILFFRGGFGNYGLPVMFTPLSYSVLYIYELYSEDVGERKSVDIIRADHDVEHDIVLVIDESVSGNYLDINSSKGVLTNLDYDYEDVDIYNYGYASSISSCSAEVNLTLRYGGTRNDYHKINSTMPSLWKYAKLAGLSTIYVDAQRTDGNLQNGMTANELEVVDQFIQFDNVQVVSRDIEVANKLATYINNDVHELIVVNKIGAHFPVHDKYPDEFMKYVPVLTRGNFENISDSAKVGFGGSPEEWVLYRNSYRNTLLWNVGEFFRTLFLNADMNKAVIIYTSDHGQDLHERENPGKATHCGANPVVEEGVVPLLIIQGAGLRTSEWDVNYKKNKNSSSHYNIFPTILELMGYDSTMVESVYGRSLSEITNDPLTFNTKFNARLGTKPVWRKINIHEVVEPLNTDYYH